MEYKRKQQKRKRGMGGVKPLIPRDFHWKILDAFVHGNVGLWDPGDFRRIAGIIRARDVAALFRISDEWSPQCMNDQTVAEVKFFLRYQASSLLKKFQFPGDREARIESALCVFRDAEASCSHFNKVGKYEALKLNSSESTRHLLPRMRRFIRAVLGECSVPDILSGARHGPGSSLATTKGRVSKYFKFSDLPYTVTREASDYGWSLIRSDERWYNALKEEYLIRHSDCAGVADDEVLRNWSFSIVKGNRIEFVPKDARKERTIAIEPLMNLMIQLGVDRHIRRRLKRFRCDLDDQTRNQRFAFRGSLPGGSGDCTLDLSAASDSISIGLCQLLLPKEWYHFLMALRSPIGEVRGEVFSYEKISSMGNGYTFALESLIFLAAAYAVAFEDSRESALDRISVYGDDIIVPPTCYFRLVELLQTLGFKVNREKSFFSGPFRESCGMDYFRGTLVRPLFIKEEIHHVTELFSLCNRLRLLHLRNRDNCSPISYWACYQIALKWVPAKYKNFVGPPSEGEFNTYLHMSFSRAKRLGLIRYRYSVFHFKRMVWLPRAQAGRSFHFRKLMVDLRPSPRNGNFPPLCAVNLALLPIWEQKPWDPTTSGGNSFTVTLRNQMTVTVVSSSTSFWE
jgi:hypothetical protein